MYDKNECIIKKLLLPATPRAAHINLNYIQNSFFTLCTVLILTLDSFAVFRTE